MRLIDADYVDKLAKNLFKGQIGITFYQAIHALLESIKPIDAVPVVHAEWKAKDFSLGYQHFIHSVCSNCGNDIKFDAPAEYCSRCGARMDEKDDSHV